MACPWALLGDFNDILHPSEQREGIFSRMRAEAFARVLNDCELLDLEYIGSKFTWQRNCVGGTLISRRLDRGLGDHAWHMRFHEGTVEHLMRRQSDHNPLLLRCWHAHDGGVAGPSVFKLHGVRIQVTRRWSIMLGEKGMVR